MISDRHAFQAGILACALALAVAGAAPAAAEPAGTGVAATAPAADPTAAAARGVDFLVAAQRKDGSWGSFESRRPGEIWLDTVASHAGFREATSALACAALIEPAAGRADAKAALARGIRFLLDAPPLRRATGGTFYNTWAHVYRLECFARLARDSARAGTDAKAVAAAAGREIEALARLQGAEGGFGYYDFGWALSRPSGHESTSFLTAAALVAFHEARAAGIPVPDALVADALRCLERLRLPDGAYIYGVYAHLHPQMLYNRVKGSLGRSQPCNVALWLWQRPGLDRDDLAHGVDDLRRHHHFLRIGQGRPYPHEAWYYTAGYYFFFGHRYAALAIAALEPERRDPHQAWLRSFLAGIQEPDGSWWDFPFYGYHKEYGTALALLALQALR